jgi:hypothetical protein
MKGSVMIVRLKSMTLAMLVSLTLSGCHCWCPPKEWFSSIDRYCFVADWTNDYSCTSCRYKRNCCQQPTVGHREYDANAVSTPADTPPNAAAPTPASN